MPESGLTPRPSLRALYVLAALVTVLAKDRKSHCGAHHDMLPPCTL